MATNDDTTLDFFTSTIAVLFTILFEGSKILTKDDGFLKRLINLDDVANTLSKPVKPSSFAGVLWNDPYVRVMTGMTVFLVSAQIFGMRVKNTVNVKRRKRYSNIRPW
jgi:hypothetical protein